LDSQDLKIQTFLNDELKQESSTGNMIFPVFELISFVSRVGPMAKGDTVKVVVEGIGELQNKLI